MTLHKSPVIRRGELDDIAAVYDLNCQSFQEAWSENSLFNAVSGGFELRLVESNADICAYLLTCDILDECHIMQMAVATLWRRKKLASRLLQQLLDEKKEMVSIELEVRHSNQKARALYAAFGFVECGRRKAYYAATTEQAAEDAVLMRKVLGEVHDE